MTSVYFSLCLLSLLRIYSDDFLPWVGILTVRDFAQDGQNYYDLLLRCYFFVPLPSPLTLRYRSSPLTLRYSQMFAPS